MAWEVNGFDKCASPDGRNILPMPWNKLGGCLIHEWLHINILDASWSERQSKVLYGEVGALDLCIILSRSILAHLIGMIMLLCTFVTSPVTSPKPSKILAKATKFALKGTMKIVASSVYREVQTKGPRPLKR
jgi:hypothetical protein